MTKETKIKKVLNSIIKSDSGDVFKKLVDLGKEEEFFLTGDDFKKWKEQHDLDLTWGTVAKLVGLTERRCTDLAGIGEDHLPARVSKIIILSEFVLSVKDR